MPEIISDNVNRKKTRWLLFLAIIFFVLLVLAGGGGLVFVNLFEGKIYPNVYVGNHNLGGQTLATAEKTINQAIDKINQRGIVFSQPNKQTTITPVLASADGDLAYQIISFSADQAIAEAFAVGRGNNFFTNLKSVLSALAKKKQLPVAVMINREEVEKILKNNFSQTDQPAQDARLVVKKSSSSGAFEFSVEEEKFGKTTDYKTATDRLATNLASLDSSPIELQTVAESPKIFRRDCLNIESKAREILNSSPFYLKYGPSVWTIDRTRLSQYLILKPNNSASDKVRVGLDDEKLKEYLTETIAPAIDKKPVEAKFEIKNGRVTEFQTSQDGQALNLESTIAYIEERLAATDQIELVVEKQPALVNADNINNYGIKEIIGVGTSTFAGSPANRRHNIKVGSEKINGLLVKPGEEFSLLNALGEVDAAAGYLPELVIKENKTTPEYGGGLCQVGTTMFRSVLASGLPVTMRRNHSYRVSYYEPAGTDATIYDPWPDFRFINDTANHILIQTKIATDTLAFEFWGTSDGRQVERTRPTIYNIVKPEPTKIVETLDLKPGEKKCTETAHNGADAYFDYKVVYPTGEVKEKRFSSHYVPWREVCLLGVEKLSLPAGEPPTATSTTKN